MFVSHEAYKSDWNKTPIAAAAADSALGTHPAAQCDTILAKHSSESRRFCLRDGRRHRAATEHPEAALDGKTFDLVEADFDVLPRALLVCE